MVKVRNSRFREPAFLVTGTRQWKISFRGSSRNVPGTDFGDLVSNHVPTASKNMFWHQLTKFVPRNVPWTLKNGSFTGACQFLKIDVSLQIFRLFRKKFDFLKALLVCTRLCFRSAVENQPKSARFGPVRISLVSDKNGNIFLFWTVSWWVALCHWSLAHQTTKNVP